MLFTLKVRLKARNRAGYPSSLNELLTKKSSRLKFRKLISKEYNYKRWMACSLLLMAQACTQFDDYLLGKDNTPTPQPLPKLNSGINIVERWSLSLGSQYKNLGSFFKLKPAISGDTLYVANPAGRLLAVHKNTGQILWSKQLPVGIVSGPIVANNTIVLGTNVSGLIALEQTSGATRWQVNLSGDVLASPLITDEQVVAKTIDGHMQAVDIKTGKKHWNLDHGAPNLILQGSSSPQREGNMVFAGFSDGKLDAVDLNSGRLIWQRSIAYSNGVSDVERLVDIDADPLVASGTIYSASYQGYVSAISQQNGDAIWNKPASTYKNLALDKTTIYMTDSDDTVWALSRMDGHVLWKQLVLKARQITAPVHMGSWIIVGDKTGLLHVMDAIHGHLVGRTTLRGSVVSEPLVSGNQVYVMTDTGQLICFSVGI